MATKTLKRRYIYGGQFYGPGDANVPDSVANAEDLSPAFKADLAGDPDSVDPRTMGSPDIQPQPQGDLTAGVLREPTTTTDGDPIDRTPGDNADIQGLQLSPSQEQVRQEAEAGTLGDFTPNARRGEVEATDPSTTGEEPGTTPTTDNYDSQTNEVLATQLEQRGLPKTGNKEELIARLRESDANAGSSQGSNTGSAQGG